MADEAETHPTLDAKEMALVDELGSRRQVSEGEYLYREGDVTYDFFVLVSAEVDIVVAVDGGESLLVHHEAGRFLGELNMLTGLRVFVSARVVKSGEVIVVARDRLRQLMARNARLGDTILAAFMARRDWLMSGAAPAIRVIGSQFSPESLRVREFLARTRVPHEWLDPDRDAQVDGVLRGFGMVGDRSAGRHCNRNRAATTNSRRAVELSGAHHRKPARTLFRPRRGGRRTSRSRRGGIRSLRRSAHPRSGDDRARRTGRDDLTDRELPRVSHGHLRIGPDPESRDPGREIRGESHRSLHRGVPARPSRTSGGPSERRKRHRRAGRDRGDRGGLSPTGGVASSDFEGNGVYYAATEMEVTYVWDGAGRDRRVAATPPVKRRSS